MSKNKVSEVRDPIVGLVELLYGALQDYQDTHKDAFEVLTFKDSVEAAKTASALMMADESGQRLDKMASEFDLKPTTYYKYRRQAAAWGIDGCEGKRDTLLVDMAPVLNDEEEALQHHVDDSLPPKEPTESFEDVPLPGLLTIDEAIDEMQEEAEGKDLEDQFEIFDASLQHYPVCHPSYTAHILRKIS